MKIFLDTSSLFKLYQVEEGTTELFNFINSKTTTTIFLSEISKIEFSSTIWKKVRAKQTSVESATETLKLFILDSEKYYFTPTGNLVIDQASSLITKYGLDGLRTLDSIQLSTCLSLKNEVDIFITHDKLLKSLLEKENLNTDFSI